MVDLIKNKTSLILNNYIEMSLLLTVVKEVSETTETFVTVRKYFYTNISHRLFISSISEKLKSSL